MFLKLSKRTPKRSIVYDEVIGFNFVFLNIILCINRTMEMMLILDLMQILLKSEPLSSHIL